MRRLLTARYILIILIIGVITAAVLGGCAKGGNRISIAGQYGLAYAPLEIMKQQKILEKNLPGIEVEWKQLQNTAAIREAMLSNQVDAGFMAIPPFLIGYDKGMEWKIACGLSSNPVSLITYKDSIKSIKDFTKDDRIAMPQPGSVQDILLSMASEKELGDPHKLSGLVVTLSHPDGMNALLAKKDISAHFTAPPYSMEELESPGMHEILDGKEIMGGDFTFIVGVTTDKFHGDTKLYDGFIKSVKESIDFINNDPKEAAAILSGVYDMSEEDILKYLSAEGVEYSTKVKGTGKFIDFMKRNGYISKDIADLKDIMADDVDHED